jgi:hypothetical protein
MSDMNWPVDGVRLDILKDILNKFPDNTTITAGMGGEMEFRAPSRIKLASIDLDTVPLVLEMK